MRPTCSLEKVCPPKKKVFISLSKSCAQILPAPSFGIGEKKSYLYAELMSKPLSPLTTLWGFKAPGRGRSGEVPQYRTQGAQHPLHLHHPPPAPLRGLPATPCPGAGSAPGPSPAPCVTPPIPLQSVSRSKAAMGEGRGGKGREGALVSGGPSSG